MNKYYLGAISLFLLLTATGCANRPQDVGELNRHTIDNRVASGDYILAIQHNIIGLQEDFPYVMSKFPDFMKNAKAQILEKNIDNISESEIDSFVRVVGFMERNNAISKDEVVRILSPITKKANCKMSSETLGVIGVSSDTIYENSLSNLRSGNSDTMPCLARIGAGEQSSSIRKKQIWDAALSVKVSSYFINSKIAPAWLELANALSEKYVPIVIVKTNPDDRLLEEDLIIANGLSNGPKLVREYSCLAANRATITIKKLQYEFTPPVERMDTVSFKDYQVDTMKAVLLMPRNSTYSYDKIHGESAVDYAFEVFVDRNDRKRRSELIRGSIKVGYLSCKNQRIINVFGGVQPANFVANDQMKMDCSDDTPRPTSSSMRNSVMSELAMKIRALID